jgi:glycosyltransferase 2 family protein
MNGAQHRQRASWAWSVIILRWVAGLAILGALLHFLPITCLRATIGRVPPFSFTAVLLGYLLVHCIGVAKWRMVVNSAGADLNFATSTQCYAGGLFGALFLPSILGGDVVRLAVGLRRSPRPAAVLAGNVVDRFLDATAQATLVAAGLILLPNSVPLQFQDTAKKGLLWIAGGVVVLTAAVYLSRRALLAGRSMRFRRRLARLRHALRSVSRQRHILAFGWLLGTCIQGALLLLAARVATYCGLVLPVKVWLFAWPLAKLAALLPLTQGGIGVREAALVALLVPFGASGPLVLAAGLLWEGIIISGGLVAGVVALLVRRFATLPQPT